MVSADDKVSGPSGTLSGTLSTGKEPLEGDSRTGEGELPNNPF